ncbi:MAG TPA: helix-turn-helix domain-containing protein [Lacipirellulaceae bacterium]|nr:helix-turn-helix domain-containing protein [Lacipirellulaceae bacterium]
MTRQTATIDSLTRMLNESSRPIYVIDAGRRIVYCNRALAAWLDMAPKRIVGRVVEYHSEPMVEGDDGRDAAPLTDLCPPPRALVGEPCTGTLSCMAPGGRLVHRQADFIPLGSRRHAKGNRGAVAEISQPCAVLAVLAETDTTTQELASALSGEQADDELHRTIRHFRRGQAGRYAIESLLGTSPAMEKVRAQVAAAAACGANVLVCGPRGCGRGHVARAIHYQLGDHGAAKMVAIDCELLTDDLLRRTIDRLRPELREPAQRPTLLLENIDRISAAHQLRLAVAIHEQQLNARIIATYADDSANVDAGTGSTGTEDDRLNDGANRGRQSSPTVDSALLEAISTITIQVPPLADRVEDLPILAHCFLESCNQGGGKQVGSLRSDALDMLSLYSWPGDLDQLREVISAAHRACSSHEVLPADLPSILHRASFAASTRLRRQPERIVLDELLASIEKEAIVRALSQARGNKSEAASLLGMTRPRLYRRLVQLGLVAIGADESPEQPEFVEQDSNE